MSAIGKVFDLLLLQRLFAFVKPYRRLFMVCIATTISLAAISPVRPWLVKYTFDQYIITGNTSAVVSMTLLMIGLLITEGLIQFGDAYLAGMLGQKVVKDLRTTLYRHILNLKMSYFDRTPIGMLVTRTVSDMETIADIFSEGLIVIIGDLLKLVALIGVMLYINVTLTLISLSTIPLLLLSAWLFKNAVRKAFQDVRTQVARLNAFIQEHLTGMSIVQIFNRETIEMGKFKKINQEHTDANIRSVWHYSVFFPVVEVLSSISLGLIVWWGCKGVLNQVTTLGELNAFMIFLNMIFRPIRQLADKFNTLQMGMVGCERVFKVLDTQETIADNGTIEATTLRGEIAFNDVWFAYSGENWVLKNVSFHVQPGQTVAIVGATGAGKSSIINILSRFYEFQQGKITIDGVNLREYAIAPFRKQLGVVLQDVFLFSSSIVENIRIHHPAITNEETMRAARAIGAHEFISRLPDGYDYHVMERGAMLSSGQRQLIAFIRAYVYNPSILILDEATSAIDTESEQLIQQAIKKITQNRTSIIIAHRLATIQNADMIIVLDHGAIVEKGTHEQLLAANGHYKKLFELQFKK